MTSHTCTTHIADYYPFGMEIQRGFGHNQPPPGNLLNNRYLYNSKEYQDDFELNWYDYGARFYDAQIARWHSVDPHAENYLSISPYAYVANNPIIYIDPDGRDYMIYFEEIDNQWQIRISATYYVRNGDEDSYNSAKNAIAIWNNASNNFSLSVENEDGTSENYSIVFDLTIQSVENPQEERRKDLVGSESALNPDGGSNIYSVVSDRESLRNPGICVGLFDIRVRRQNMDDAQTGPHEVGHTLGLRDLGTSSNSVMAGGNTGATTITPSNIMQILNFAENNSTRQRVSIIGGPLPKGDSSSRRKQRRITRN
jgi:RHS repeat-associated protein